MRHRQRCRGNWPAVLCTWKKSSWLRPAIFTLSCAGVTLAEPITVMPADFPTPRQAGATSELTSFAPAVPPQPAIAPPEAPPPPSPLPLATAPRFLLRGVKLEANTVLDQASIDGVVDPFIGNRVTPADLEEIRRQLTLLYVNRGFINSGVVIPDQKVDKGFVVFRAVEGRVSEVEVSGTEEFDPGYFHARLCVIRKRNVAVL